MAPLLWPLFVLIVGVHAFYKTHEDAVSGNILKYSRVGAVLNVGQ
jgi:hypothetical protein